MTATAREPSSEQPQRAAGRHRRPDIDSDETMVIGTAAAIAKAADMPLPSYRGRHGHDSDLQHTIDFGRLPGIEHLHDDEFGLRVTDTGEAVPTDDPDAGTPLGSRLRKGALWSAASTLLLRFGNIAIMAVVARVLTKEDFGVFAVAMTIHLIIASIAELGVAGSIIRADVDLDKYAPTVAAISLISSIFFASIMFVFAEPISGAVGDVRAAPAMRVMALAVLLVGIFAVPGAELARNFRQAAQFRANLWGFALANSLLLGLALGGGGPMAFAWSRVAGQAAVGISIWISVGHTYRPKLDWGRAKFVLAFGLPLAGANLLNFVLLNADYVFVSRLLGATLLGVYMLAFNISSWSGSLMNTMLNTIAMPAFSRLKHDADLLESGFVRACVALSFVALPIASLTAVLAHPLVRTVYGTKWDEAADVVAALAAYGAISVFCLLCANVLSSLGRTNLLLVTQVPWLVALIGAMAVGVHVGGIVGAAWSHIVVVTCVALPVYLFMVKRSMTVRLLVVVRAIVPVVFAAAMGAAVARLVSGLLGVDYLRLLLGGAAGSIVYLCFALPLASDVLGSRRLPLPGAALNMIDRYAVMLRRLGLGMPVKESHAEPVDQP